MRSAPVGVVGAIVPWNVPQFVTMPKLVPALIAGCTVVIKPAPETPLDAMSLAEMLEEADLPRASCRSFPAAGRPASTWCATPASTRSRSPAPPPPGAASPRSAASSSSGCSLELGGKSAAIILDDADLDSTVAGPQVRPA